MTTSSDLQRTARHWSSETSWQIGRGIHWLELPTVQRRLNEKVSDQPDLDWLSYSVTRYLGGRLPLDRCLSLGCGKGALERRLASEDVFLACDAIDIAPGSVSKARASAEDAGLSQLNYEVADANKLSLPTRHYDAVWSHGAVHHFERLEHVFEQVAAALKPGGLFILNEYVGPTHFQFPQRQREIIQSCHDLLPARYRQLTPAALEHARSVPDRSDWQWFARRLADKLRDGDLLNAINRRFRYMKLARSNHRPLKEGPNLPTERSVRAIDPSEAIRSAEILPLLRRFFRVIEQKDLGGSILQFLLADIAGNFQDPTGERLLRLLFEIEDRLMETGDLASDFVYLIAAPRLVPKEAET